MRTLPPGRREEVPLTTALSRLPPIGAATNAPMMKDAQQAAHAAATTSAWGYASDGGAHGTDLEGHHFRLLLLAAQVEHPAL
jgi:hypothetical protein